MLYNVASVSSVQQSESTVYMYQGFPGGSVVKNPPANAGDTDSVPNRAGRIPWRRKWQPTSVFLPGKHHEKRSLVGYRPCGRKESDMTERLSTVHCFPHISHEVMGPDAMIFVF